LPQLKGSSVEINVLKSRLNFEKFSLAGGPLYGLGCKLGLVSHGANTVKLGLALGLLSWTILLVLALVEGVGSQVFSFSVIGGHVRLLLVVPLFFVCESIVIPRMTVFIQTIVKSRVVPDKALPDLESLISRLCHWKNVWLAEFVCLLASILLTVMAPSMQLPGTTPAFDPGQAGGATMTGFWYWSVCLTLFRFIILRWLWLLGLWFFLLWRISKQDLNLVPTHPDGIGGLGYLEVVHAHFTPLVLAISLLQAGMFADEFSAGRTTFEAVYPIIVFVLVFDVALFLVPMFMFSFKLWACRAQGLSDYMELAADYVNDFDKKWVRVDAPAQEPLLGTADLQSLADLNNSMNVVSNMRWIPVSKRLLLEFAIAALLPMLPLLLLQFPASELTKKFFTSLVGI
jgi:hypothetical protein